LNRRRSIIDFEIHLEWSCGGHKIRNRRADACGMRSRCNQNGLKVAAKFDAVSSFFLDLEQVNDTKVILFRTFPGVEVDEIRVFGFVRLDIEIVALEYFALLRIIRFIDDFQIGMKILINQKRRSPGGNAVSYIARPVLDLASEKIKSFTVFGGIVG